MSYEGLHHGVDATSLPSLNKASAPRLEPLSLRQRATHRLSNRIPKCPDTTPMQSLCRSSQQASGKLLVMKRYQIKRSQIILSACVWTFVEADLLFIGVLPAPCSPASSIVCLKPLLDLCGDTSWQRLGNQTSDGPSGF